MGSIRTITAETFPRQGEWLGKRVNVCFHGDADNLFPGTIVREDNETPFEVLIKLDSGRYIRGEECAYQLRKQENA